MRHAVRFLAVDEVDRLSIAEIIDKLALQQSGIWTRPAALVA
jgi:hypothetical protein